MPKDIIVSFKLDSFLLEQMDLAAQRLRITRSELIRRAITYYLAAIDVSEMLEEGYVSSKKTITEKSCVVNKQ